MNNIATSYELQGFPLFRGDRGGRIFGGLGRHLLLLLLILLATFLPLQTAACDFMVGSYDLASERLAGDVTGDGVVDLSDFNAIINLMLGKATSEELMADVTGDGMVDIADVNGVINKMLGKIITNSHSQNQNNINYRS